MRLSLRAVLVSLVAFVAIGGAIAALPEAKPKATPSTTSSEFSIEPGPCDYLALSGVSEFIDFGGIRPSYAFCAAGFHGSGRDLLSATTKVEGTTQYPVGFVCRIDGWPNKKEQNCKNTPTYAQGSWAYFLSNQDGTWSFSGTGSTMHRPACGTSEAWLWVAGGEDPTQAVPTVQPSVTKCEN